MRAQFFDMSAKIHRETEKAILISDDGDEKNAKWVPLSQIEITNRKANGIAEIIMPEWLAKDKGFV